ncbi:hypothetical protein F5884DRAFT_129099 [Xylogone sp. PMI_703]|nr:hypothetical protein F5884DRAFT_129099 [Xylogone sp. PMI_703]
MSLKVYRDQILEKAVKPWLKAGHRFVLEEDNDSGHGTGKRNIVRKWKEEYDLESYFNCVGAPDLSPIENAWLAPKEHVRRFAHWDDDTLRELAEEGWAELSQKTINDWIDSIPQRLKDVIANDGKFCGF